MEKWRGKVGLNRCVRSRGNDVRIRHFESGGLAEIRDSRPPRGHINNINTTKTESFGTADSDILRRISNEGVKA